MLPLTLLAGQEQGLGTVPGEPVALLMRRAHEALRSGGVLVGHMDHVLSLPTVRTVLRGQVSWRASRAWKASWSGAGCLRALHAAGFDEAECFFIEPRISAPTALVPLAASPARAHFVSAVRRTHAHYTQIGYFMRLLLASAGLGGWLQPHLFFWARRRC